MSEDRTDEFYAMVAEALEINMGGYTREELLECARRELKMRIRVYPNFVQLGKMSWEASQREIAMMRAICGVLEALTPSVKKQMEMFG